MNDYEDCLPNPLRERDYFPPASATLEVGDSFPVWWDTYDGAPSGKHMATILGICEYTGKFRESFSHVLKLTAPRTDRGWLLMTVTPDQMKKEV